MPEFAPQVIVKLTDDVAASIPYDDNAQNHLPFAIRSAWDSTLSANFPGVALTLNRIVTGIDPSEVHRQLDENANTTGTPSHNLLAYFAVPVPAELAESVASVLQALPFVEYAYVEQEVTLPAVSFADDPLVVGQGYFGPAPIGVDAFHVWALPFADGSQVRFVDVEFGWQLGRVNTIQGKWFRLGSSHDEIDRRRV
jgi:hypothetical protein